MVSGKNADSSRCSVVSGPIMGVRRHLIYGQRVHFLTAGSAHRIAAARAQHKAVSQIWRSVLTVAQCPSVENRGGAAGADREQPRRNRPRIPTGGHCTHITRAERDVCAQRLAVDRPACRNALPDSSLYHLQFLCGAGFLPVRRVPRAPRRDCRRAAVEPSVFRAVIARVVGRRRVVLRRAAAAQCRRRPASRGEALSHRSRPASSEGEQPPRRRPCAPWPCACWERRGSGGGIRQRVPLLSGLRRGVQGGPIRRNAGQTINPGLRFFLVIILPSVWCS